MFVSSHVNLYVFLCLLISKRTPMQTERIHVAGTILGSSARVRLAPVSSEFFFLIILFDNPLK